MKNRCLANRLALVLLLACVLSAVTSCKPKVPSAYIQPDEMEDLLYDYHISQAMAYGDIPGEKDRTHIRNLYYHAVLRKYNVTEAEFDSSLVYYYTHADRLSKIYKRVSERLEKSAMSLGASEGEIVKYSQFDADGDTANIWRGNIATVLRPEPPCNRLDFTIEADSTFRRGDSFLFNFMAEFVYQSGTKDAVVCMAVRYDNDSVSSHYTHVNVSGLSQLRVPECTKNDIKQIKGFIYLSRGTDRSATQKLMFIDRIQLIRFHKQVVEEPKDSVAVRKDSVAAVAGDTSRAHTVPPVPAVINDKGMPGRRRIASEDNIKPSPQPSLLHNEPKKDKADSRK